MYGPYGSKDRDGSRLVTSTASSRDMGVFEFTYHAPKDDQELARLLKEHPAYYLDLVRSALETAARGKAWGAAREQDKVTVTKPSGRQERVTREVAQMLADLQAEVEALKAAARGKAK